MLKGISILVLAMVFSIASFAKEDLAPIEKTPLKDIILKQILNTPGNYARQNHTDFIFAYGTVEVQLDKLTLNDVEELQKIMTEGIFVDKGFFYDIFGIEWKIQVGRDHPRYAHRFNQNKFKIVFEDYQKDGILFSIKRKNFVVVPELHQKRVKIAQKITAAELNRVTQSDIAIKTSSRAGVLHLNSGKSCPRLFN